MYDELLLARARQAQRLSLSLTEPEERQRMATYAAQLFTQLRRETGDQLRPLDGSPSTFSAHR
jgi:hypothetical protein